MFAEFVVAHGAGRVDDRVDALAEVFVGKSDDGARPDGRMCVDRGFDFGRVYVRAPGHDHVGLAIGEVEVALGVEISEVAERLPAVVCRGRIGPDVAIAGSRTPCGHHVDFAHDAGGTVLSLAIEYADLASFGGFADGAGVGEPLDSRDLRARGALRAPVGLPDALRSEPVDPRAFEPRGTRRPGAHRALQGRQVVARALFGGKPPDALHHGRNEERPVHPVPLDQRQGFRRVESGHHDGRAPGVQALPRREEGTRVVERSGNEGHAADPHAVGRDFRVDFSGREVEDQFRATGAAARRHAAHVDRRDIGKWVRRVLRSGREARGDARPSAVLAGRDSDDERRIGEFDDGVPFDPGERRRDRLGRGAELPGCGGGFQEFGSVGKRDRHQASRAHPPLGVGAGEPVGAALELGAGEPGVAVDDGDPVRLALGKPRERATGGEGGHRRSEEKPCGFRGLRVKLPARGGPATFTETERIVIIMRPEAPWTSG